MRRKRNTINMEIDREWKKKSKSYLRELQKFLDKADNIENEALKRDVIMQMLKCDDELTKLAEEKFQEYFEQEKKW